MALSHLACSVTLLASACSANIGFGVGLTIATDDSVTSPQVASVRELVIEAGGDESGTYEVPLTTVFARYEELIYRELPTTHMLSLAVSALDANNALVAYGETKTFTVNRGSTFESVILKAAGPTDMAMRVDLDAGVDLALPDLTGDDLAGRDFATPPNTPPGTPGQMTLLMQTTSSIELMWGAATPGSNPIAHYQIYRNGAKYATSTTPSSFTDSSATNAVNTAATSAATPYRYAISAVDEKGVEGPKQTSMVAHIYDNGASSWAGDDSYSTTPVVPNRTDTNGMPTHGTEDIAVVVTTQYGAFVPVAGGICPTGFMEVNAFDTLSFQLKSVEGDVGWNLYTNADCGSGENCPQANGTLGGGGLGPWNPSAYGPKPANTWQTYNVPLKALGLAVATFTATISGTTMTVTAVDDSTAQIGNAAWLTGPGITTATYIVYDNGNHTTGTYTISQSYNISTPIKVTAQRTAMHDFQLGTINTVSTSAPDTFYLDDIKLISN